MSLAVETFDKIAAYLVDLVGRFGPEILDNRRRLQSFLADSLPDARREIRTISTLVDERVHQALKDCDRSMIAIEMDRQVERLADEFGMQPQLARNAIRAIGHGLGLGPPPSVYEDARAGGAATVPAMPAADAGSWAGLSEPVRPAAWPEPQSQQAVQGFAGFTQREDPGKKFKWIAGGVGGALVLLLGIGMMMPDDPATDSQVQGAHYADEAADYGVAAKSELESNVGSPTPLEIPGAERITTAQLVSLRSSGQPLLVDVLANPHPQTIAGAVYEPTGGMPGTFADQFQAEFAANLRKLTGGDTGRTLVFFCAGPACWESYNAALRANHAGYTDIKWYRGGLAAWAAAGQPMASLPAAGTSQQAAMAAVAGDLSQAPAQANSREVEQFVRRIYASYGPRGEGLYNLGEHLTDRAVRAVEREAERFGADPICQCQDWDGISVTSVRVASNDSGRAVAEVSFKDITGPARKTTMHLMKTGKGWRLDDLTDEGGRLVLAN